MKLIDAVESCYSWGKEMLTELRLHRMTSWVQRVVLLHCT